MTEAAELSPEIVAILERVAESGQMLVLTLPSGKMVAILATEEENSSSQNLLTPQILQ